jgi:phage-related baseplate assembly protein
MSYTLADLLDPPDEGELTTTYLAALTSLGFPVSSWPSGGAGRTLVQALARVSADALQLVGNVARGGLLDLAPGTDPGSPGDWLTLFARSAYGLERRAATFAVAKVRLTAALGAGPYTITPGQLWAVSSTGRRYNSANTSNVTVLAGPSTVDIELRGENPGAAYNLGLGAVLTLETPLPGVTAATVESSLGSGTAMVVAGTDQERDATLRDRCRSRWSTIGLQHTADAYDALARQVPSVGDPEVSLVTRTRVDDTNPRGAGTVNVWIAGDAGPLDAPEEAAVDAYLQARKSVTADLQVANATAVPVAVTATLYVRNNAAAADEAEERLTAAINAVAIGGTVYRAQLLEELMTPAGVFNVVLAAPAADVALDEDEVATVGTITLTQVTA